MHEVLEQLVRQLRARNIDATLRLFTSDAIFYGSELGEYAVGAAQLRLILTQLFEHPHTYGWSDFEHLDLTLRGDVIWFVGPALVVRRDDEGNEDHAPYRLSGVLETMEGCWLIALFNGAEPVPADAPQ